MINSRKKISKIIYTAGVIVDKLYDKIFNYDAWPNKYVDHMTIQFGNLTEKPTYIGVEFDFIATHVVSDDKGVAWIGQPLDIEIASTMNTIGQRPHITLFTANGVKPVYSNELIEKTNARPLKEPVMVRMKAGMFVAYDDGATGWEF
jgi:tRNA splicing ligase